MSQQMYSPNGLKSNTPTLPIEPTYDTDRLKTDPAYRYGLVDALSAHLNSILPESLPDKYEDRMRYYTERVRYYLDTTVAMGLKIPEFDATLKVDVFEGEWQLMPTASFTCLRPHVWCIKRYEKPYKRQHGHTNHSTTGIALDRSPTSSSKEWKFRTINKEEREILCKEWFQRVRFSRFPRWSNWENKSLEERIQEFVEKGRQVNPANYTSHVKEQRKAIDGDIKQFIEKYRPLTRRGPESERIRVQRLRAKKLIANELAGSPSIDWTAFTVWYELEWVAILWGMLEYRRFLKLEASTIKVFSSQNNTTSQPIILPIDDQINKETGEGVAGAGPIEQRVLALFVWYCQEARELPGFLEGNKLQGWKDITAPYALSANGFKNQFTQIQNRKSGRDYRKNCLSALGSVVDRLKHSGQYPNALAMVEKELHEAELNSPV